MSITGKAYSVQGGYGREGYLLCQKHLNAQGGLLGRPVELMIYDDESDEKTAVRLYEKLITEDKVDAILGPYGTAITEAVAEIPDKHRKVMVAANAATSSIWEKGRKYLIMVLAPVNSAAIGALDLAARNGLKKVAIINQDALLPKVVAKTTDELAKSKSLDVVLFETYPTGTTDFSTVLKKVQDVAPDLLVVAAVRLDDHVAIIRQMKGLTLIPKWRAVCPMASCRNFISSLERMPNSFTARPSGKRACQIRAIANSLRHTKRNSTARQLFNQPIPMRAVRFLRRPSDRPARSNSEKLRETLLSLKTKTILGDFAVDQRGFQTGQKAVTIQWQDGKQAVVWPDGLGSAPRFPTPNWAGR